MTTLEAYAYLWDGSEPGWKLHWTNRQLWRIRIVFSGSQPTTSEIRALRKLLPELRALSARDAVTTLRTAPHYDLPDPVGNIEMRSVVDRAKALDLEAEATVEDHSCGVPIRDDRMLIIEDDAIAREICERMKAAGVPVEHTEVD